MARSALNGCFLSLSPASQSLADAGGDADLKQLQDSAR